MATKIQMPKLSDTMSEGTILKWRFKEGDKVKQGDILVEIESDKADMELEAYDSGILRKIFVAEGGKAKIGAPIAIIADAGEDITALELEAPLVAPTASIQPPPTSPPGPVPASVPSPVPTAGGPVPMATDARVKASPLARKIAAARQIDLRALAGSGPQGRIVKRDLEGAVSGQAPAVRSYVNRPTQEVPLSSIRKTIAKRMTESKQTVPQFYVTVEVDMEPAMAFRDQLNSAEGVKIGFTDIIVKACGTTLMRHPQVNATFLGESARQYGFAHIAIAVALDEGLVTPVVRHVEQKGLEPISAEIRDLVERARNRKLKPEEYSGGTFTISNLGMFGVDDFIAIVNPPEGAILAVGSIVEKPVVRGGQIVVGHTMKLTLSSDHRIIDGAVAARFLQDLRHLLEHPALLLFRA
jgi:pyruvate dehydrogenase E2 component (dihydrolipoamide acetyltransferase)